MKKYLIIPTSVMILVLSSCSSSIRFSSAKNHINTFEGSTTETNNNSLDKLRAITGIASYYADKFDGRITANGEKFDQKKLTAAHKTLPFGTVLTVKNLDNGKTVNVRVNDRGPFVKNRVIDLSKAAAKKLEMINAGLANVEIRIN